MANEGTYAMIKFADKLVATRISDTQNTERAAALAAYAAGTASFKQTGDLIGWLKNRPLKDSGPKEGRFNSDGPVLISTAAVKAASEPVTEGIYILDDEVYKVQKSKTSGNLYAKKLQKMIFPKVTKKYTQTHAFTYAPGAIHKLTAAHKATFEQAKKFGMTTGSCMICGRTLTKQESIDAGIGPVCAKSFG